MREKRKPVIDDDNDKMEGALAYWGLLVLKALLFVADCLLDLLTGHSLTGGSRGDRFASYRYESSAHLVAVRARAQYQTAMNASLWQFLYLHEDYVHPRYVLENRNVTLMAVESEHALFCVSHPDDDVFDTRKYPFTFLSQFSQAKKLLILPLRSLHQLAEEAGDPEVRVAMINMTARCGSTLLSQMFARVPNVRSISEPFAFTDVHSMYRLKLIDFEECKRLLKSVVRLTCKVEAGSDVRAIVVKLPNFVSPQTEVIAELFPDMIYVFNTRHPRPSIKSFMKIVKYVKATLYFKVGLNWSQFLYGRLPCPYRGERYQKVFGRLGRWRQNITFEELGALSYAGAFVSYADSKDIYSQVVLYEDLRTDPEEVLRKLFKLLDLSAEQEEIAPALEALHFDTQANTFAGRETKVGELTDAKVLAKVDAVFADMGLPVRLDTLEEEFEKLFEGR